MLEQCKVGAIVLFVREISRACAFYRDVLGVPVEVHDTHYATGEVRNLSLVFIAREARAGDSPVMVFEVDGGIDDYAETLAAKGVEIVAPVSDCPDGGLSVDFGDPDGNGLSIYQPPGAPRRR